MSNAQINSYALEQNPIASDSIGILGGVAHKMTQSADYLGTVYFKGREIGSFDLKVTDTGTASQLDLDLFAYFPELPKVAADTCCDCEDDASKNNRSFTVAKESYLVLHASEGPAGYNVTLDRIDPDNRVRVYDSKELATDDVFFATLLRPGTYNVSCQTGQVINATVSYPVESEDPFVPSDPRVVDVTQGGFGGGELTLTPAQGVVFNAKVDKAWVKIELVAPNNGPADTPVRWNNPLNQ